MEMVGGGRKGFLGVEGSVVAVSGVDGAEIQFAYDTAHGCVRLGCWRYIVSEG